MEFLDVKRSNKKQQAVSEEIHCRVGAETLRDLEACPASWTPGSSLREKIAVDTAESPAWSELGGRDKEGSVLVRLLQESQEPEHFSSVIG